MSIPQPKILTAIVVPTGGWSMRVQVSVAGNYDTNADFTVAAGTYYLSGDNQSDDFLYEFRAKLQTALNAALTSDASGCGFVIWLDDDHKVNIKFLGSRYTSTAAPVKLVWTNGSGASIAAVMGFDGSADDASTSEYPGFTSEWHHAYGWYADDDGLLEDMLTEDETEAVTMQARAHSGRVITQLVSERWSSLIKLNWLPRAKTFSRGVGYTETNAHPYERNEALECWWELAKQGRQFRVYRNANMDTARAVLVALSAGNSTTFTVSGVTLDTDPYEWAGKIAYTTSWDIDANVVSYPQSFYIQSHTSSVVTVPNAGPRGRQFADSQSVIYLLDHAYETYVLDVNEMRSFKPREVARHGLFAIELPLLRYVA